ncbi:hypothetical protein chiPu_0026140 [Chiloscyllium punctatum]|uniref:Uncharacterized protein n=1 Tax=Chiloscyllium punctatum TaxID=137246 RepID=A0A401THZ1_CHIPU|nr:hypothetical protein [Chiloscyllium punctatum]
MSVLTFFGDGFQFRRRPARRGVTRSGRDTLSSAAPPKSGKMAGRRPSARTRCPLNGEGRRAKSCLHCPA